MNEVILPTDEYFKFGNFYSGSITNSGNIFNYYISFSEKYICKIWSGMVCLEKAENIIEKSFEIREEVFQYLCDSVRLN